MNQTLLNERYRLDHPLGRGGMGEVFRAHDTLLGRDVAVKLLSDAGLGSEGRLRLLNEARAAAQLNHPNIVTVFDAGEMDNAPFIVMELVDGQSLDERRPHSLDDLYDVARQICQALAEAHARGIIHRDLKPENVLVTRSGTAKLTDFGLARSFASRLTSGGAIVGTVFYMAPEVMLGQPFDGRADLYALGVMLYELTAGRLPFVADNPLGVISQHIHAPVTPPGAFRPDLPAALENVILKLLAKDPNDRYPDAPAVIQALNAAQNMGWTAEEAGDRPAQNVSDLLEKLVRGRLVGRQAEMRRLHQLWKLALSGQAQLALLSGEPGIGKTRLANELAVYVRLQGAVALRGGCYEYEAATPYLPFIEALREWARRLSPDELRRMVGDLAPELVKLIPDLAARLGPVQANPPLGPNEERLRLFDHVARLFERLAQDKAVLLFVDDIHWVDQSSLALLNYLLRSLRQARLMVLACYREVELDRAHPLSAALVDWSRERLSERLPLGRLALEDVDGLLSALLGGLSMTGAPGEASDFAKAVYAETEGNPFFVEEVLKSLIQQGQIFRQEGQWQRAGLEHLAIPQSIKEAIGRRLDRLAPACLDMLHTAAALGKRFDFAELNAVTDTAESALLDALDEAERAQLLRPDGKESYTFTHDKIREVLYEELNAIRRRRLHRCIGEGLEALYRPQAGRRECEACDSQVQTLSYHFIQAGELERGLPYTLEAAKKARAVFALDDALAFYRTALESAQALDRDDRAAEIYETMGFLNFDRGDYPAAVQAFENALRLTHDPQGRAHLQANIGMAYAQIGDARGMEALQQAIRVLDAAARPHDAANALAHLGRYYHYQRQYARALDYLEQARAIAEPLERAPILVSIYAYFAGVYQQMGAFNASLEWAHKSIALGERTNNQVAVALGYEFLAEGSYGYCRWRDGLKYAQLDLELGRRIGSQSRQAWAYSAQAHSLWGLGELQPALEAANACVELCRRTQEERLEMLVRALRGRVYADLGEAALARADHEYVSREAEARGPSQVMGWSVNTLAYHMVLTEDWPGALALSDRCEQLLGYRLRFLDGMAYVNLGMPEQARTLLEMMAGGEAVVDARDLPNDQKGDHQWIAAMLHGFLGHDDLALAAFQRAVDNYQADESRVPLGRVLYYRALYHLAGLRRDQAAADARQSCAILETCGEKPFLDKSRQLLASL